MSSSSSLPPPPPTFLSVGFQRDFSAWDCEVQDISQLPVRVAFILSEQASGQDEAELNEI